MALARNTDFTLIDYSDEIELIPRVENFFTSLGLFETHYIETTVAQVERIQELTELFNDRARGGERNFIGSESAATYNLNVPFFPLDRGIKAADIQNFRKYGEGNAPKTVQDEVIRVMARIRRSHAQLVEKALVEALKGASYSPSGLASYNYYTLFGETQATADINFTDTATDPAQVIEDSARAHIIDNADTGADSYRIVVYADRQWFSAYVNHPLREEAYKYYTSTQEPLRQRLGGDSINRTFVDGTVTIYEDISGFVGAGDAYIFPMDIPEMFRLYFGPADDLPEANQRGRDLYLWYKENPFDRKYKVESETSMLAVCTRPELVVLSQGTYA